MSCCQCQGIEREFDAKLARRELRRYQRRGPRETTRLLVEALQQEGLGGKTLLDIGGGIGAVQLELLRGGVQNVTGVDASSAYLQTAQEEAARQGYAERTAYVYGDFVEVAPQVEAADLVTLDRVICCYPDLEALVDAAASRARTFYALVYPRDDWWMATVEATVNLALRIRRSPMRFFVHPAERVDGAVRRHGFDLQAYRKTLLWQVAVYRRQALAQPSATSAQ